MHGKNKIKLFTLLKGYSHYYRMSTACTQMIAQAIIFNTIMLQVSVDMSTPPLANMRFTIANYIYILDIMFKSKSCKHS